MALNADYLVKLPLYQKLLILGAVVLVLVLGYGLLIDANLSRQYREKQEELKSKKTELTKLEAVEKDKEKLDRELKEKERKLEKAKEKLPTETEMERLLLTISDLGQENGITFQTFKPLNEQKEQNLYIKVPIELKFTGAYKYVMNFFYQVTTLPRIVNFSGVTITGGGGKKTAKSNEISVSTTAVTYKFLE